MTAQEELLKCYSTCSQYSLLSSQRVICQRKCTQNIIQKYANDQIAQQNVKSAENELAVKKTLLIAFAVLAIITLIVLAYKFTK